MDEKKHLTFGEDLFVFVDKVECFNDKNQKITGHGG